MKKDIYTTSFTTVRREWEFEKEDFPELISTLYVSYQRQVENTVHKSIMQEVNLSYTTSNGTPKSFMFKKGDLICKSEKEEDILGEVHKGYLHQGDLDMSVYDLLQKKLPRSARNLLIRPTQ